MEPSKFSILFFLFLFFFTPSLASNTNNLINSTSYLRGMELPSFNVAAATNCDGLLKEPEAQTSLKFDMKHRFSVHDKSRKQSFLESAQKDATRIHTIIKKTTSTILDDTKQTNSELSRRALTESNQQKQQQQQLVVATLESGVDLGSGEYLIDVYIGTPPRHFRLIMDTGSDLNWLQCAPCRACFPQDGPVFEPNKSSSYRNISCGDPRCGLVSSPEQPRQCLNPEDPCPYYYWYGDLSNTTGDLALEAFTVNLTSPENSQRVEDVIFGCGHWNRGLFHGAAGLLGLGRGPLSFASQLHSVYGEAFSYCLVDQGSNINVSSKIVFGEDRELLGHPLLNYTAFVAGTENQTDTFYYVKIKGVVVGGEVLNIPVETWDVSKDGAGGTIVDSGTTLSYFANPAYQVIKDAFANKVKMYPLVEDFPVLSPCYNVSGIDKVELPEFSILFADGAVWNFPAENYFIRFDPEDVVCLAILGTPRSSLSILGNYQQQNFHVLYDLAKSRLGFAPRRCAEV